MAHHLSAVKKLAQREVMFPASSFMMTALEFVFPSSATWSLEKRIAIELLVWQSDALEEKLVDLGDAGRAAKL